MSRILAIQLKRIGDLILTVPALALLKRKRPGTHLTLATWGAAGQLVPAIPAVDEHLSYRPWRPNAALWTELASARPDAALDFNGSDRSVFLTWLSQARLRATYTKRAQGRLRGAVFHRTCDASLKHLHTVDHMIALLETLGIDPEPEPLRLAVPETNRETARAALRAAGWNGEPYAVVHAGTARAEKYWLPDRWATVIRALHGQHGLAIVLTGGRDPHETEHLRAIQARLPAGFPLISLAGKTGLLETAAVLEGAAFAVGVDTAAMHLAAAFQRPQVVLYGPTPPWLWRPRHGKALVIHATQPEPLPESPFVVDGPLGEMAGIQADSVVRAARVLLS